MGGGQNLCAEVADLLESSESTHESNAESMLDSYELTESNPKSTLESTLDSRESSESTLNQRALWQSNADEKTGGFLGFEYGLGFVKVSIDGGESALKSGHLSSYINIIAGYQWYFLSAKWAHLGLRFGGGVGYSSYGVRDKFVLADNNNNERVEIEAHNVRYGADLALVWDFLDSYIHTLGIFVAPVGLEGNTITGKLTRRTDTATTKHKIATTTKIAYKLSAGVQYSFKRHHLLFFAYRLLYNDGKIPKGAVDIYGGVGSASMRHSGYVGYAYKF